MSTFAPVKPSALTAKARGVLAVATVKWHRMPIKHAATIGELERFGLVETKTEWQWSKRDPGAGRHVVFWRRKEAAGGAA